MNAVIIFDVSDNATAMVIQKMGTLGYYKNWVANGVTYNLPSNIIWKPNTEHQLAYNQLVQVIAQINSANSNPGLRPIAHMQPPIRLLRCLILNSVPWLAMVGEP